MIVQETQRTKTAACTALLARAVQRIASTSGDHRTAIPELTLYRRNRPSQPVHCIYTLGMAVTVQGSKHVLLGDAELSYGPGQSLLTTIDLPVSYHITRATAAEPYLGIMLTLDRNLITQVASRIETLRPEKRTPLEPLSLQRLDASVLDALHRLIQLLGEPQLIPQLAPLIQQEIIIRLLSGPHAPHLWNLVNDAGPTQQIARAVGWMREHFADEMRVGELAEHANMSLTTFRQHFRAVTGMSPVQLQKLLRLQEARQLMLDQKVSAGSASALVGYESASQFTREYRRLFGAPPQTDIRRFVSSMRRS
jgi:AraC-like DNA-binding protein